MSHLMEDPECVRTILLCVCGVLFVSIVEALPFIAGDKKKP